MGCVGSWRPPERSASRKGRPRGSRPCRTAARARRSCPRCRRSGRWTPRRPRRWRGRGRRRGPHRMRRRPCRTRRGGCPHRRKGGLPAAQRRRVALDRSRVERRRAEVGSPFAAVADDVEPGDLAVLRLKPRRNRLQAVLRSVDDHHRMALLAQDISETAEAGDAAVDENHLPRHRRGVRRDGGGTLRVGERVGGMIYGVVRIGLVRLRRLHDVLGRDSRGPVEHHARLESDEVRHQSAPDEAPLEFSGLTSLTEGSTRRRNLPERKHDAPHKVLLIIVRIGCFILEPMSINSIKNCIVLVYIRAVAFQH